MKKLIIILALLIPVVAFTQEPTNGDQGIVCRATILDGDTVPYMYLDPAYIYAPIVFKNKKKAIEFTRLVRYIKKVYPYAKYIGLKYTEYNELLSNIESKTKREKTKDRLEESLRSQFEGELVKLTFTQGKLLMKLIDRETSYTTYQVVDHFKGGFQALFWNSFGKLFGYNLKDEYEPEGKDRDIEMIVIMIESGTI
jgi:Domain of unknown function (DUF4294)